MTGFEKENAHKILMSPQISVITPVYNGADFIQDTSQSVLSQSVSNWEWIIVNDGSTDGTADVLEQIDDPRITVIHQANAGVSAARNRALDLATGTYVTFLDADDILPANALELRQTFLNANPQVDIANGGVRIKSGGQDLRQYTPSCEESPFLDRLARLEEGVFLGTIYMLRRACIGHHRFPVGVTHSEDLIFFLMLAHECDLKYGAIPDVVYEYRQTPDSAMSNLDGIDQGYMALLETARQLPRLEASDFRVMQKRIASILAKSWIRKGKPHRALSAVFRTYQYRKATSSPCAASPVS